MTKITIETETIETELTPSEAVAKIKEALGIAEFPQSGDKYHSVDDGGRDFYALWVDGESDRYRLAHGNCSPTQEGLAQYKADMAKLAAIVAIRKHRDKTFGAFEPDWTDREQEKWSGYFDYDESMFQPASDTTDFNSSITIYFAKKSDLRRSFTECSEHWEVLK